MKTITYMLSLLIVGSMYIGRAMGQSTYFKTIVANCYANHYIGIKTIGTLWAWGLNSKGQLGNGGTTVKSIPTQVGTASNWLSIAAGDAHSLGITADGNLWAWGQNTVGQLGDGTAIQRNTPTKVGTASNWVSISGGSNYSLGITADGKLWAWGYNNYGQLGSGTIANKSIPTQVGTASNWVSIAGGNAHSLGITADGKLWAWGYNALGQLGNGTNTNKFIPTQVGTATNWVSIYAGSYFSLGITADGKLWAWGQNSYGQLGDGTLADKSVPTQVGAATNWVSISAGSSHSLGITADGKLWAWGYNGSGELGNGTNGNYYNPNLTQVGTASNWVSITGGQNHSLGITANYNPLAWGSNINGQLGDGTYEQRLTPILVSSPSTNITAFATTGSTESNQQGQYNMYSSGSGFIASISSTRASLTPIKGLVTAKVWVETTQPAQYVNRHYEITPSSNAGTYTGRPTLYFTQAEFDNFNLVNSTKLPTNSSDATGIANLLIEKRSGTSSDGTGLPGTYTSTPINIDPADADIIWNTTLSRWEVSFDVTGFSGFFVKTQSATLPLKLIGFVGSKVKADNHLVWITTNEFNTKQFTILWSMNALQWNSLATITATGNSNNTYSYNDSNVPEGKIFYRLKMIDRDEKFNYSNIICLSASNNNGIVVYPNPIKNIVGINVANCFLNSMVSLTNMEGKLMQRILITNNQQNINVQLLPKGMYLLKFTDGTIEKLIKE